MNTLEIVDTLVKSDEDIKKAIDKENHRIKCKLYRDTNREHYRLQRREYMKNYMKNVYENNKEFKKLQKEKDAIKAGEKQTSLQTLNV